ITAVTDAALARFSASIQNSSSTKLSFVGKAIPWTRNVCRPRTFSRTRTNRLPSEKCNVSLAPRGTPSAAATRLASPRLAEPANSRESSSTRPTVGGAPDSSLDPHVLVHTDRPVGRGRHPAAGRKGGDAQL